MRFRNAVPFFLVLAALLLQACGPSAEAAVQTAIAATQQIAELQTAAAVPQQPEATATSETLPEEPTATPPPLISVSQNTNCRRGPATNYDQISVLSVGEQAEVLKTFDSEYVVVDNPTGSGDCWLWLRYADKTDFSEYDLPIATAPPTPVPTATPTPTSPWEGSWNMRVYHGGVERTGSMGCSVSGLNITCSVTTNDSFVYNFSGTLDASHQNASGTFTGTGSGNWAAQLSGSGQFVGNLNMGSWDFCGTRSGSLPNPCKWP
ncbi:MAG: hypothetical protein KIS85_08020 [Anaerolineales bacterium]|nr:hypothetical protein [Anaerolineales bacterium]